MNKEQAFNVLEQALAAAAKAGVFNLKDSATVYMALEVVRPEAKEVDSSKVAKKVLKQKED